ncbi:unnamed protein product [Microthlaspi erraticum]|uniref:MULE transposase domain-containing protein n=1 Tax=Microthlaspi erraticum TaxID=1685480 RepID=A0A6D2J9B9_9BRAS|nr:unnamed protein product [Microthlaspi erraticum]
MEEHCLVMCGEWRCSSAGQWDFLVDKNLMSRVIVVQVGISLEELKNRVVVEFFPHGKSCLTVALSYWPPNTTELATGIRTPPVILTNEGRSVSAALGSCSSRGPVRPFVSSLIGRKFSFDDTGFNGADKTRGFSEGSSSGCVQTPSDETLFDAELMEDVFFGDPEKRTSSAYVDGLTASDSDESCGELPPGAPDVRPVGYDKEFWEPLISDPFGGSDAVDIMCPPSDGFDGKAAALGKRRMILCSNNDAFDHYVLSGDVLPDIKTEGVPRRRVAETPLTDDCRPLEQIDDEEFDIPPMFNDTKYVTDDIPDLDIEVSGECIYVGRLFNSKVECQITLAIHAIKEMFHFKQSTTKRHYFIVSCVDKFCDWRVRAKEVGDCGYYEITKATLDHSCCIDTRNAYRKKSLSRVIAAVFRAKYGDPDKGPRATQLQRMLANPGTVTDIETELDVDGNKRFLYAFLSFGASITGFSRLRRVVVVDGTHLLGKYKGVLLTAVGQDANFQVFPLAYALVDSEYTKSWTWFLQRLERILGDSSSLVIVSDRATSLYAAIAAVYLLAVHVACIVHLARNVNSIYNSKGLGKLVTSCFCLQTLSFQASL